jgi:hypothetical protein
MPGMAAMTERGSKVLFVISGLGYLSRRLSCLYFISGDSR